MYFCKAFTTISFHTFSAKQISLLLTLFGKKVIVGSTFVGGFREKFSSSNL